MFKALVQAGETQESFQELVDKFEPLCDIVEKSVVDWSVGGPPDAGHAATGVL